MHLCSLGYTHSYHISLHSTAHPPPPAEDRARATSTTAFKFHWQTQKTNREHQVNTIQHCHTHSIGHYARSHNHHARRRFNNKLSHISLYTTPFCKPSFVHTNLFFRFLTMTKRPSQYPQRDANKLESNFNFLFFIKTSLKILKNGDNEEKKIFLHKTYRRNSNTKYVMTRKPERVHYKHGLPTSVRCHLPINSRADVPRRYRS